MALENITEQIKENASRLLTRAQESSAWNQAAEKYNSLSPTLQKLTIAGVSFVVVLILLSIPGTFYFSSQSTIADYEDRQALIRQLFHVSHAAASLPPAPPSINSLDLQTRARNTLNMAHLQPEQIIAVGDYAATVAGVPKTLDQAGAIITLSKLNLKQIVDIGSDLQTVHPMARLMGVEIKAIPTDNHRFDVVYKLVAYSPQVKASGGAKSGKAGAAAAGGAKRAGNLPPPPIGGAKGAVPESGDE